VASILRKLAIIRGSSNLACVSVLEFFIACLVAGLEYVHNKNILHRDIKPENLVLDEDGYLRITDFGIAREWREENSQDTSGTPGYMAPEVMCRQNHGVAVDYFAAGVMAYECMFGRVKIHTWS
jgi:serine/threonine protein kinase